MTMGYNGAFKNYRSQLNGWAIGQAAAIVGQHGPDEVLRVAKSLADFAYVQESDFDDLIKRLGDVLKADEDPIAKADMLIGELEFLKEQMGVQKAKLAAAN